MLPPPDSAGPGTDLAALWRPGSDRTATTLLIEASMTQLLS
jgi:hypothetical protein